MADHAVGSRISLISKSEIRYEGFLNFINANENTVGLKNVRMHGTEGRKGGKGEIPANNQLYEYIVFRGADIKDLTVYEDQLPDPAIISATPAQGGQQQGGRGRGGHQQREQQSHGNGDSNPWHQNRDHGSYGRGRGGDSAPRGRGGYQQQQHQPPAPRGRGGAPPAAAPPAPRGRGAGGFADRKPAAPAAAAPNAAAARGPRLEHTGREFAPVEGGAAKEFKDDFDFSKARGDIHEGTAGVEAKKAYDKTSSFFDNLSSDVTDRKDRARGQAFRDQQKKVDTETFGGEFVGAHANTRYRRAGRGRGRYGSRN